MSGPTRGETFVLQGEADSQKVNFTTFLFGLASTTLIHLGAAPHPETGKTEPDLILARESLALLDLLREKTRGNLTTEEDRVFEKLLADLKLRWVESSKR